MEQNINKQNKRTFAEIAREIKQTWKNVCFRAKPYLRAMATIDSSDKNAPYMLETTEDIVIHFLANANMLETAEDIVIHFLANATYWRGEDAKRIKAELKSMIK